MNKKLTFIIAVLIGISTVKAQTQKGNQLLGGNIGFGTGSGNFDYVNYSNTTYNYSGTNKTNSFSFGPVYSYFIADNLDLGTSIGYSSQKVTYNYSVFNPQTSNVINKNTLQSFTGSVYLRKYFLYNQKIGIRTGPYVQYQNSKYQYEYLSQQNIDYSQTGYNVNAGLILDLVYFPVKRLGIASNLGSLAYSHNDIKNESTSYSNHDKSNSFGLGFSSTLNLSVFYCFGK